MNTKKTLFRLALLLLLVPSLCACIRDEALNSEADILSCSVDSIELVQQPVITNDEVRLYVNAWDDVTSLAPTFTLTEGATIEPASGTVRDFTEPQEYTVTSQDGKWQKTYTVSFLNTDVATSYHFENMRYYTYTDSWTGETKDYFHILYETRDDGTIMDWASGNSGFMITNSSAAAVDYPTAQCDSGYVGKCAKLVTRSTGQLGAMFHAPIAAGNLFLGTFQINISNTLKSTHFGVPYSRIPLALTGYYRYKPGAQMTDRDNNNIEGTDNFNIYAVFYETSDALSYLDGTNVLTSDAIVLKAVMKDEDRVSSDDWRRFSIEFEAVDGKEVDTEKLNGGKYSLAIVMTSSQSGAAYTGAVGSTLYVDELELYYQNQE